MEAKLTASDASAGQGFGICVAISGNAIVVGAPYDDTLGTDAGAAYVYTFSGGVWSQTAKLLPSRSVNAGTNFAELVAISGDRFLASAPRLRPPGNAQACAAYVSHWTGASWDQEARLPSNVPQPQELFGFDIALDGTQAVIGGFLRTVSGQSQAGAVYVYRL